MDLIVIGCNNSCYIYTDSPNTYCFYVNFCVQVGSFQVFVKNFKDASEYLQVFEQEGLTPELEQEFQLLFEKLVILDYITRNTGWNGALKGWCEYL